jgi:hypothetical protein
MVLDLQAILPGLLQSIVALQQACKQHGVENCKYEDQRHVIESFILEFDEYIEETKLLIDRSKVLIEKSSSTADLVRSSLFRGHASCRLTSIQLSDLLNYEEAVALKELTRETQMEGKAMCGLTVSIN